MTLPDDSEIIEMLFLRKDDSVSFVMQKYGKLFLRIAKNILTNNSDAEECVNDVYLKIWNSIPPVKPDNLSAYGSKITRNIALSKIRYDNAQKRSSEQIESELDESVPDTFSSASVSSDADLSSALDSFLRTLNEDSRRCFILRYWYSESIKEISRRTGHSQSKIKSILHQTRLKLKSYLEKEDISL